DAALSAHVADDVHDLRLSGTIATLVANGDRHVDTFSQRTGAHHAPDVGRHNHEVVALELLLDVTHHRRRCEQVVGRDVEEALDLSGVQVEGHHAVGACTLDQVGHQL